MDVLEFYKAERKTGSDLLLRKGSWWMIWTTPPPKNKAPVLEHTQLHIWYCSLMVSSSWFSPDGTLING